MCRTVVRLDRRYDGLVLGLLGFHILLFVAPIACSQPLVLKRKALSTSPDGCNLQGSTSINYENESEIDQQGEMQAFGVAASKMGSDFGEEGFAVARLFGAATCNALIGNSVELPSLSASLSPLTINGENSNAETFSCGGTCESRSKWEVIETYVPQEYEQYSYMSEKYIVTAHLTVSATNAIGGAGAILRAEVGDAYIQARYVASGQWEVTQRYYIDDDSDLNDPVENVQTVSAPLNCSIRSVRRVPDGVQFEMKARVSASGGTVSLKNASSAFAGSACKVRFINL